MIGKTLAAYRIVDHIGDGGMGSVYKAVDVMLEREVAVKMLRPELARRHDTLERFRSEAIILGRLNHSNIATLYGLFSEGEGLFMAMEFVHGETLEALIVRSGRVPWERAVEIAIDALGALDYAHRRGVVHRDIKPANLMFTDAGTLKIMDFGIARILGTHRQTRVGRTVGTPTYMAPEQILGHEGDARTDLYALGAVLYELVTGRPPFAQQDDFALMQAQINDLPLPPRQLAPDVPEWLNEAILQALAKAPEERFPSAGVFQQTLRAGVTPSVAVESRAVPATRLAYAHAGVAGGLLAGTRLPADVPARPPHAKETRLAASEDSAIAAGVFSRLNWRHYVGAAAVLVTLAAAGATVLTRMIRATTAVPSSNSSGLVPAPAPAAPPPPEPPVRQPAVDSANGRQPGPAEIEKPISAAPIEGPTAKPRPVRIPPRPPLDDKPALPAPEEPARPLSPAPQPPAESEGGAGLKTGTPPPVGSHDLSFQKVKMVVQSGDDAHEIDVVLSFYADRLVIAAAEAAKTLKTFPYQSIASASYAKSRKPLWKTGAAPIRAAGSLVSLFSKPSHWLTVQSAHDFAVLHLDGDNYRVILPALETRSGKRIETISGDR
jgi:tRNA A-37 threonylcarbamoyl transferase component Bud32